MTTLNRDIERKVKRAIRQEEMIKKQDIIQIKDSKDCKTQSLIHILTQIIKDPSIKINVVKKPVKTKKLAVPTLIEEEAKNYLEEFTNNKSQNEKNIIKPLKLITKKEIETYTKANKIKCEKEKEDETLLTKILIKINQKHPQIYNSIIKSKRILK